MCTLTENYKILKCHKTLFYWNTFTLFMFGTYLIELKREDGVLNI